MCPDCLAVFDVTDLMEPGFGVHQENLVCPVTHDPTIGDPVTQVLHPASETLYWYWIAERHNIYLNRQRGRPKPWSTDPIFQKYKFVNVFRRLDRTTDWLIKNFLEPHKDDDPSLIAFNICWFRMFSRWQTGASVGWLEGWDQEKMTRKLNGLITPFTGAYIIHSEPGMNKVESISEACSDLEHMCFVGNALKTSVEEDRSMEVVWKGLQQVRHVGPFMAYQMVLDMMYVPSLLANAVDRNTWTCTGPGALRGLRRLDAAAMPKDSLQRMRDLQARSAECLAEIGAFHVPALDIHDIEFALCELDKYSRVLYGEGKPRSTYPGAA